jgi:predicted DNA-binding transcriptional regulator AlpA
MSNAPDKAKFDPSYDDRLIDEFGAADFLGYSVRALRNWRTRGGGPQYVKVSSRSIRYRRRDLMAWTEARLCASTSDTPPAFRHAR